MTATQIGKHLKPGLGAAGAFVVVFLVRRAFGTWASLVVLAVLLLAWALAYIYAERTLNRILHKLQSLGNDERQAALENLAPEIRSDMQKRLAKEKPKGSHLNN